LSASTVKIDALGSGSDFSPFLQHIGVASIDLGFGGENDGGEYHSIYDSYDMYKRFKDPGFQYSAVLAKTAGRMTLRLANADIVPFNFHDFSGTLNEYVSEVMKTLEDMRSSTELNNQLVKERFYILASDPSKKYVAPVAKDDVPHLDFSAMENAMDGLKKSVERYDSVKANAVHLSESATHQLNMMIYQSEQKLLQDGLPNRGWYKHAIYAPGYYQGYGVKTLPGPREAIENRDWKLAQQQISVVANVISNYTRQIDAISDLLRAK
jgi:N-acetylated-alpha-linked acidic dipeptidase